MKVRVAIYEVNFGSANSCISHQLRYENTVSWIGGNVAVHTRGGTPIHYLYGYVPPKGVVILKLLV